MKIVFNAMIHDFELLPNVRMTQRSKFTARAQRYLKNKGDLAILFMQQRRLPALACLLKISFTVNQKKKVGDIDNYMKSICDALQDGGIIENDRLIKAIGDSYLNHGASNSVMVMLETL